MNAPSSAASKNSWRRKIGQFELRRNVLCARGHGEPHQGTTAWPLRRSHHRRLHSSLSYLRPVDYYRGDPTTLLAERRRKLQAARQLRKQENLKLRQRLIPWRQEAL